MGSAARKDGGEQDTDNDQRRLDLSLVLEFPAEDYLGADGEINEDLMCREALDYVAETAGRDEFEVEISRVSENDQ